VKAALMVELMDYLTVEQWDFLRVVQREQYLVGKLDAKREHL
jgi:hypothetical protein